MRARALSCVLVPLTLSACVHTTYRDLGTAGQPESMLERRVSYRTAPAFYAAAPSCAAIRTHSPAPAAFRHMIEQTVERHLATRLTRVVGAARLRHAETRLGIDVNTPSGRRVFARQARCRALMEISLTEIGDDYVLLWAERRLALKLTLKHLEDGKVLWSARHRASRSDGGLPISVLSLPISAVRAAHLTSDPELFASIADDAVRRMMKTLPDTRESGFTDTARR